MLPVAVKVLAATAEALTRQMLKTKRETTIGFRMTSPQMDSAASSNLSARLSRYGATLEAILSHGDESASRRIVTFLVTDIRTVDEVSRQEKCTSGPDSRVTSWNINCSF
jgi:hypothetical protein